MSTGPRLVGSVSYMAWIATIAGCVAPNGTKCAYIEQCLLDRHVLSASEDHSIAEVERCLNLGAPQDVRLPVASDPFLWFTYRVGACTVELASYATDEEWKWAWIDRSRYRYVGLYWVGSRGTHRLDESGRATRTMEVGTYVGESGSHIAKYFHNLDMTMPTMLDRIERDLKLGRAVAFCVGSSFAPETLRYRSGGVGICLYASYVGDGIAEYDPSKLLFAGYWSVDDY